MRYERPGEPTSAVEVTNVSEHGFWLLLDDRELFLPFETFPWFRDAPIGKILRVELPSEHHLHWPELDIDLELDSIVNPEGYPLVSKVGEAVQEYAGRESVTQLDWEKIEDAVLALFQLTLHDDNRAWKGFDFEVMDRLYEKGYLFDTRNKTKSVALTDAGLKRSKQLFERLFEK